MEFKVPEYYCKEGGFDVTDEVKKAFEHNGCVILRDFLPQEELDALREAFDKDRSIQANAFVRDDGEGKAGTTIQWNKATNDLPGLVIRSEKAAGTVEKLLGGEVYIYHIKITLKEPYTGGAFVWHQDYGFWYEDGSPMPNMGTLFIAVDKANRENGCLKIFPGSHKMGRVEHHAKGAQLEADLERVDWASKHLPLVHAELEAGDAMFFHCNILHRSEQNNSPHRRFAYLCAYNRCDNSPISTESHASAVFKERIVKVPNSAIMKCQVQSEEKNYYLNDKKVTSFTKIRDRTQNKTV